VPSDGYPGHESFGSMVSEYAQWQFVIRQFMGRVNTATIVKVTAVTNSGGVEPVGFVDVIPMVAQTDGVGNTTPHAVIHKMPYTRIQGGTDAVILDPKVGDLGIAVFAQRDISAVKQNKDASPPGSFRRFAYADGMYIGGLLNGTPAQYVRFSSEGIEIKSPTKVTIDAPDIVLLGDVASTGTFTNNTVNISSTHVHGGVQTGGGDTAVPH
jgi:hypothetical protein